MKWSRSASSPETLLSPWGLESEQRQRGGPGSDTLASFLPGPQPRARGQGRLPHRPRKESGWDGAKAAAAAASGEFPPGDGQGPGSGQRPEHLLAVGAARTAGPLVVPGGPWGQSSGFCLPPGDWGRGDSVPTAGVPMTQRLCFIKLGTAMGLDEVFGTYLSARHKTILGRGAEDGWAPRGRTGSVDGSLMG